MHEANITVCFFCRQVTLNKYSIKNPLDADKQAVIIKRIILHQDLKRSLGEVKKQSDTDSTVGKIAFYCLFFKDFRTFFQLINYVDFLRTDAFTLTAGDAV